MAWTIFLYYSRNPLIKRENGLNYLLILFKKSINKERKWLPTIQNISFCKTNVKYIRCIIFVVCYVENFQKSIHVKTLTNPLKLEILGPIINKIDKRDTTPLTNARTKIVDKCQSVFKTDFATHLSAVFFHIYQRCFFTFISGVFSHLSAVFFHIYQRCFFTFISGVFSHLSAVFFHIYQRCFFSHLSALFFLHIC